jgi:hypothetical protein
MALKSSVGREPMTLKGEAKAWGSLLWSELKGWGDALDKEAAGWGKAAAAVATELATGKPPKK